MDQDVFTSLARIRILLLPVGSISRTEFEKWADEINHLNEIRLSDVPTDSREDRARFMPNPLANGALLLRFVRHPPPSMRAALSLFRPSEFPLGIIGIATSSQMDVLPSLHAQFLAMIAGLFPTGSIFPLAKSCFVFEEGDGSTSMNVGSSLSGMVVIPGMMGNKKMYIETLIAELCSNILGEFSIMVKTLETPAGSEALTTGLFGSHTSYNMSRLSLDGDESYRAAHIGLARHSQPDISDNIASARSADLSKLPLKRASTLPPPAASAGRNSTLLVATSRKRQSAVAAANSHAKLYKVLGDLFLMSGRTMDSSIWYNEALALLKQPYDSPWQASALEGLAISMVLEASATEHDQTTQGSKELWTDVIEKLGRAVSLFQNAATYCDSHETLQDLSFLYASACLRQSFLLYSLWKSGGWNYLCFSMVLHGGSGDEVALAEDTGSVPTQETNISEAVPRSDIALALGQTHGPWLLHLGPRERTEVLRYLARIYSQIQYHRKEAYVLRELLACLMDFIVHGREERKGTSDTTPAAPPDSASEGQQTSTVGVRQKVDSVGNSSIVRIVKHISSVFDLDLNAAQFTVDANSSTSENGVLLSSSSYHPFERYLRKTLDRYAWPDLQLGMAREALAIAEALPDNSSVVTFSLSALYDITNLLDPEDQYYFYTSSARAMATARRRGDEKKLKYWPGELAISMKLLPLPLTRTPVARPWSDLRLEVQADTSGILKVGPFLYNPRRNLVNKQQTSIVQNEALEFVVTLQNPFSIALELLQVTLSTSGVSFKSNATPTILAANSVQTVTITGRALEPGTLVVRGIIVHLPGTGPHETVLPVLSNEEEEEIFVRAIAVVNEAERLKVPSLSERLERQRKGIYRSLWEDELKHVPQRSMELKVVPELPFLRIRRTSLTNGAVMLYEGETSIIRLTLENVSPVPIDFLELTFEDSTKSYAEELLADEEASDAEKYETEFSLVNRPVFSWSHSESRKEISPGKESTIDVKCFGKAGCTNGTISISYSYAKRSDVGSASSPAEFFIRQLPFPVVVTVYQMLECYDMNVVPLLTLEHNDEEQRREWGELLDGSNGFEWCLLTLDVQNTYGLPFEVTLSFKSKVSSRVVSPGSTYRFFLPIERFVLPSSTTASHIPSLTNRQFIVTGLASDVEKAQRELFWYREELLKRVQASWKEAGGMRSGELSLRQQRFTQPMLNVLRSENVQVRMSFSEESDCKDATVKAIGSAQFMYYAPTNKRVHLMVHVQNMTASAMTLVLSIAAEPSDYVVYDGVLRNIPLGRVDKGKSKEFALPIMFVAQGQFKFSARTYAIEVGKEARHEGTGALTVIAEEAS